jgi:hypothetical protein
VANSETRSFDVSFLDHSNLVHFPDIFNKGIYCVPKTEKTKADWSDLKAFFIQFMYRIYHVEYCLFIQLINAIRI